jgi:hypothetical protein
LAAIEPPIIPRPKKATRIGVTPSTNISYPSSEILDENSPLRINFGLNMTGKAAVKQNGQRFAIAEP